MDLTMMT